VRTGLYGPVVDWRLGHAVGWADGYRVGYVCGTEVGAAGTLTALQHALPEGVLLDLLPNLPYPGEYQRLQQLRRLTDEPCHRRCGACSLCVRAVGVAGNLARYGTTEYPGGPVGWTVPVTGGRMSGPTADPLAPAGRIGRSAAIPGRMAPGTEPAGSVPVHEGLAGRDARAAFRYRDAGLFGQLADVQQPGLHRTPRGFGRRQVGEVGGVHHQTVNPAGDRVGVAGYAALFQGDVDSVVVFLVPQDPPAVAAGTAQRGPAVVGMPGHRSTLTASNTAEPARRRVPRLNPGRHDSPPRFGASSGPVRGGRTTR
jgi:hypothetical protein